MALTHLSKKEIGLPDHLSGVKSASGDDQNVSIFDLSSHARLSEAMAFGLKLRREGFHIFAIGEERSGRMQATMMCLHELTAHLPPAKDWVYLNNFKASERPLAFAMDAGMGQKLKGHMSAMLPSIQSSLIRQLSDAQVNAQLQKNSAELEDAYVAKINALRAKAQGMGFDILKNAEGQLLIVPLVQAGPPGVKADEISPQQREEAAQMNVQKVRQIQLELAQIGEDAHQAGEVFVKKVRLERLEMAKRVIEPYVKDLILKFPNIAGFADWADHLQKDLAAQSEMFVQEVDGEQPALPAALKTRYEVNVLVDHANHARMPIVTVSHPSYENIFGSIKYKSAAEGFETDFTLIHTGALHRANGGVLVLQADALAQQPEVWSFLKRALRDKEIRIEELHRQNGMPLLRAPDPQPIPLDVQVVIIGTHWWFDDFFGIDPEFRTYFKVRAEIDLTMPADGNNVAVYRKLIKEWAKNHLAVGCDDAAIVQLMGHSSRWSNHRERLSARFELIGDMLREARIFVEERGAQTITGEDIDRVFFSRRQRRSVQFHHHIHDITQGRLHVDSEGAVVGQVNGLTVLSSVDNTYGMPARITARTFASKEGVVSIERSIEMSGSIQDKGVMILTGFLSGTLGQRFPLSFGCSLTFEQMYVPIDGDSASLAELVAILSSLSDLPVQQNIAVTGSIDQFGNIQAVGGLHHKIEGFYELCRARGFTGTQGVVVPECNRYDLIFWKDIELSVEKGEFHIWTASKVEDVVGLMLGAPLYGKASASKKQSADDSVVGRAQKKISSFVKVLKNE